MLLHLKARNGDLLLVAEATDKMRMEITFDLIVQHYREKYTNANYTTEGLSNSG